MLERLFGYLATEEGKYSNSNTTVMVTSWLYYNAQWPYRHIDNQLRNRYFPRGSNCKRG